MAVQSGRGAVAVVVGTRPEAIKLAPVILALRDHPALRPLVVATGQHREMVGQMLATFGLAPDIDLAIGRPHQTLDYVAGAALTGVGEVLSRERPAAVVVQGDTTTAMAAALAGFHARLPVAHVEAGLRTNDRTNPFPEEMNRRLISELADLHLAPTTTARANLLRQGIAPEDVVVTGNTVIDALLHVVGQPWAPSGNAALDHLVTTDRDRPLVLVTTHRRESHGEPMARTVAALASIARRRPDVAIVLPVHPNPLVDGVVRPALAGLPNVVLTDPLDYGPFAGVLARCAIVVTDSGGVQEEAPGLGKPVLVLRDTTERPEGVAAGTARLVGTEAAVIEEGVLELLDDRAAYDRMAQAHNPYGDGHAAERCVTALEHLLGVDGANPVNVA